MFNRRRLFLAITIVACLLGASGASADPLGTAALTVTITAQPSNPSNDTSPSFVFEADHAAATFQCKLDDTAFAPCVSPKEYLDVADGPHTFVVEATHGADTAQESHSWTIDTEQPVTITATPTNPSNDPTPRFEFTAPDAATIECKLDGGTPAACTSPKEYTPLPDGPHTFSVTATDALGNVGEASYGWTIDTQQPVTIPATPTNPSNITSPSFGFMAEGAETVECKLDAKPVELCTSPKGYTGLAAGSHTFSVKASDAVGNEGQASYSWTIDTTPPIVTITVKPPNPSNDASPSFGFAATDATKIECRLDGPAFTPCSSPKQYPDLPDGAHAFFVKATDAAGNVAEASHAWTIESRAPTTALTSAPSSLSSSSAATFAFSADEPSTFECTLDGRGFEQCSSPATYHGLGDGQHVFQVRARDAVGNFSPAVAHGWTIDTTAPETTLASAPQSATTATSATFTFSASENGTFECRLDGAPFALCGSPKSYGGLGQGDHRFEVRAIDAAGNADATPALHAWKVQAPARTIATSALLAPRGGARVTKPPLLRWRPVARARYYNVQVFRGRQKILSVWPTRARLRLAARWKFAGRVRRLTPGTYRWFVWPGFGVPSARNYGQLLGQSTFVVVRR